MPTCLLAPRIHYCELYTVALCIPTWRGFFLASSVHTHTHTHPHTRPRHRPHAMKKNAVLKKNSHQHGPSFVFMPPFALRVFHSVSVMILVESTLKGSTLTGSIQHPFPPAFSTSPLHTHTHMNPHYQCIAIILNSNFYLPALHLPLSLTHTYTYTYAYTQSRGKKKQKERKKNSSV